MAQMHMKSIYVFCAGGANGGKVQSGKGAKGKLAKGQSGKGAKGSRVLGLGLWVQGWVGGPPKGLQSAAVTLVTFKLACET